MLFEGVKEKGHAIADVGVVGLGQEEDNAGALLGDAQQQETQVEHSRPPHVIRHVAHGKVQQLLDGPVVCRAPVRHPDHKHAAISVFLQA